MNTKTLFKLGTMLAILLVLVVGNAFAAKYYVNVITGLDGYNGLSPTVGGIGVGPKATINNAITAASPGDTIIVDYGNGVLYNEAVVVTKKLVFGVSNNNGTGTPVIYSLNINNAAAAPNNTVTFTGPWLVQQGLTLTAGVTYGANNLTVAVSVTRVAAAATVDQQINYSGVVAFFYNATMTTGPEFVPVSNTTSAGNLTTTAGTLTLGNSATINGILTTAGPLALGSSTLTVFGNSLAHSLGGNVTGGTLAFTMNGATTVAGAVTLPTLTATTTSSTLRLLTLTAVTATGNITASSGAQITLTAATTVGSVTNNGNGTITLTVATATGALTNTGVGVITFVSAGAVTVTGNVAQSGAGAILFVDATTISGNVTNNPTLTVADGDAVVAATNRGVIRFAGEFAQSIGGSVTNAPVFTGSLTNVATSWANGGEISFGSTGTAITISGTLTVSASRSFTKSSSTGATTISNNGKVLFANTTGTVTVGGISNTTAWNSVTNVTAANNGDVDMTARTVGTVSAGAVSSSSTASATFANGNIFFGGAAGVFSASTISTTGGTGGQIYVADNASPVTITGNVTNARTVSGQKYLRFGNAATAGFAVSIGGDLVQSGAATTAFDGFNGAAAESFAVTGVLNVSSGLVIVAGAQTGTGTFNIGSINLTGGKIDLIGGGAGTMNIVVGNSTFTAGTFYMTTSAARTLQLGGLSNKFSGAATRTDFGTAAGDLNVTLLIQPTAVTALQTITGDATTTVWPGPITVNNLSGLTPTVRFTGGNFRSLGAAVTFAAGQVELNAMYLFIGGQLAPFVANGNFVNTAGYITTSVGVNQGFVSLNGNAAGQAVSGAGMFGNFEADNNSGLGAVTVAGGTGPFKGTFNLTNGEVVGGANVNFDNSANPPTIVVNSGTFNAAPTFTSMVNVYYIGIDKSTGNELPVATNKLNNLTVATTNGEIGRAHV